MSARANPPLREEDRVLWDLVARSVEPLRGRQRRPADELDQGAVEALDRGEVQETPVAASLPVRKPQATPPPPQNAIDRPTHGKLAKGRLPIEARVDLHGLNQPQAHSLLLSFLHRAHSAGLRHVLVITGKGSSLGSEGILRRAVPEWLRTGAFRGLVSAHHGAARRHGGDGALYIRLRRRDDRS